MLDICRRKLIYLFLYLGVIPSESDALNLPVTHDQISRQIAICNNNYKVDAYLHIILQKFTVDDEVMVTIHFDRFPPGTVRKLHVVPISEDDCFNYP